MCYRGRLAPTPSGYLHLGHAQTFWLAFQRCRLRQGQLVLRHDDLDQARCRAEFAEAASQDLAWLGLSWHEGPYWQSQRHHLYEQAFQALLKDGHIYPCSCSRQELQRSQRAPHPGEEEVPYSGRCRDRALVAGGQPIRCWRFRVPDRQLVQFVDGHQGTQSFLSGRDFGDFVVWRPQVGPSYQLACVIDDALLKITEVVRGADLLLSTARQLLLYQALGYLAPQFFHCPLVLDPQGQRLAKRHDALSLRQLRQQGQRPEDILKQFVET